MDKNQGSVFMRVAISLGIIFFISNSVFFYLDSPNKVIQLILFSGLVLQILLGLLIFLIKVSGSKKGYQFFIGFIFIGWGILNILFTFIFDVNADIWWPLYLVVASLFLLITGYIKYKKIKFGYAIPGITLFIMGIWFSLFSFDIVKIPFTVIVSVLGPAFILLVGLALVLFFLFQQRHKELVITDEDSGDFDEEELNLPKLD